MTETVSIEKLELTGFRIYLKRRTFKLRNSKGPLSLAVFAPNGMGKTGLVDSLEYYFSKNGTLEHLGMRSSTTQAGPNALRNVHAGRNVETSVRIWFRRGKSRFDDARPLSTPLPDAARQVLSLVKVPFIIRGPELSKFVNEKSPTDSYKELVNWFELDPLLAVQEKLKALKLRIRKMIAETTGIRERLRDLADVTDGAITEWDRPSVLDWFNGSVLAALDKSLQLEALSGGDPSFRELESRSKAEQERTGLEMLGNLLDTIDGLYKQPKTPQGIPNGLIASFEKAILNVEEAIANEAAARSATKASVFGDVWASTMKLLDDRVELDNCPVCSTDFSQSPSKSRDGVYANLRVNLSKLEGYKKTKKAREKAETELGQTARDLEVALGRLALLAGSAYQHDAVTAYRGAVESWKVGEKAPDSKGATDALTRLNASVSADKERIGRQQGKQTYGNALDKVRRLIAIEADLDRIGRTRDELEIIRDNLNRQVEAFDIAVVEHVRSLVDKLQDEVGTIYKVIQGPHANVPPIRIRLAEEGDAHQRSAQLRIDFSDNNRDAIPGSFLSNSQIHTLALSLRLAAIQMFNTGVRIIALDDIVTSYDADHRKNIAAVLNDRFGDFQIILTTHDRHFFDLLQDHLDPSLWQFTQIKELRPAIGPILENHRVRDEEIEAKLNKGEDAANDMRMAEEEWLIRICYEFRTPTTFWRNHKPTFNELATSLDQFLKESNLGSPTVPGSSRPFLESMQRAKIENLGSHPENDPYVSASGGDAKTRWKEFKHFRGLLVCHECDSSHFERPQNWNEPVCQKCKTPFRLSC